MDCIRSSLILEREARRLRITIVDAWITPFASVFVMTPDSPHWEEFLDFPTRGRAVEEISNEDVNECIRREIQFTLSQFHSETYVEAQLVEDVLLGRRPRPSLVPVVWLSGVMMANEAIKVLTGQGTLASHWCVFYDQYEHRISYFTPTGELR